MELEILPQQLVEGLLTIADAGSGVVWDNICRRWAVWSG